MQQGRPVGILELFNLEVKVKRFPHRWGKKGPSLHSCSKKKQNKPGEFMGVLQSAQAVYLVLLGEAI